MFNVVHVLHVYSRPKCSQIVSRVHTIGRSDAGGGAVANPFALSESMAITDTLSDRTCIASGGEETPQVSATFLEL